MKVPFNIPLQVGGEKAAIEEVFRLERFSGNADFTKKCNQILEDRTGVLEAILTSSCTDALEMCGLLCELAPGDEVIMPAFTFVTTASAFALRGVKIVWADIRTDTKNIDETKIEALISPRTKAIVVVHYAGVACEMNVITDICQRHSLYLIEDAAQAIDCSYQGKALGSWGDLATFSFHETKNIHCGEGGALLINNSQMTQEAKFIRDKGTNRCLFNQGLVDKYTWVALGSSFLMSELQAAFLHAQLLVSTQINAERKRVWNLYYHLLAPHMEGRLPFVPKDCQHNAHMFYMLADDLADRTALINYLAEYHVSSVFHYTPLHRAPYWQGLYQDVELPVTQKISHQLLRLPMYHGITDEQVEYVCQQIIAYYRSKK